MALKAQPRDMVLAQLPPNGRRLRLLIQGREPSSLRVICHKASGTLTTNTKGVSDHSQCPLGTHPTAQDRLGAGHSPWSILEWATRPSVSLLKRGCVKRPSCGAGLTLAWAWAGCRDPVLRTLPAMWQEQIANLLRELWHLLLSQLQNQFLGGSLALALAGLISSIFFRVAHAVMAWVRAHVFFDFEFVPNTPAHAALQRWLLRQSGALRNTPKSVSLAGGGGEVQFAPILDGCSSIRVIWSGCIVWVSTSSTSLSAPSGWAGIGGVAYPSVGFAGGSDEQRGGADPRVGMDGRIRVRVFGWGAEAAVASAVAFGDRLARKQAVHRTQVFRVSRGRSYAGGGRGAASWVDGGQRPARPVDSVVLDGEAGEALVADAREFFASERWCAPRAAPCSQTQKRHPAGERRR